MRKKAQAIKKKKVAGSMDNSCSLKSIHQKFKFLNNSVQFEAHQTEYNHYIVHAMEEMFILI